MSTHPTTSRPLNGAGPTLWFGLLGGAAAWAVQFLAGYLITESVCVGAAAGGLDASAGVVVVLVLSIAAFAVAVAAAFAGRWVWQSQRDVRGGRDDLGDGVSSGVSRGGSGWVGLAGMVLSAVFAFIIAIQIMPLFLGGGCT